MKRLLGWMLTLAMLMSIIPNSGMVAEEAFFTEESFTAEDSLKEESFSEEFFGDDLIGSEFTAGDSEGEETAEAVEERSWILEEQEPVTESGANALWAEIKPIVTYSLNKKNTKIKLAWTFTTADGQNVKLPKGAKFYIYEVDPEYGETWQKKATSAKKATLKVAKGGKHVYYIRAEQYEQYGTYAKVEVDVPYAEGAWKKITKMTPYTSDVQIRAKETPDGYRFKVTLKPKGGSANAYERNIDLDATDREDLTDRGYIWLNWYDAFEGGSEGIPQGVSLSAGTKITYEAQPYKYNSDGNTKTYGKTKKSKTVTVKASASAAANWKSKPVYLYWKQVAPGKICVEWDHVGAEQFVICNGNTVLHTLTKEETEDAIYGSYSYNYYRYTVDVPEGPCKINVRSAQMELKKGSMVLSFGKKSTVRKGRIYPAEDLYLVDVNVTNDWNWDEETYTNEYITTATWKGFAKDCDHYEIYLNSKDHSREVKYIIPYDQEQTEYSQVIDMSKMNSRRVTILFKAVLANGMSVYKYVDTDYNYYDIDEGTPDDGDPVAVTGVTLNKNSLTLTAGGTETLTATVAPSNATNKNVSWTSDNTKVATVTDGKVQAVAAGTATITVTTADGGKTATCAVTVNPTAIPVTGVSLNKTSLSLAIGKSETLTATVAPSNATNKTVTWTSSNTNVATVSNGTVTAKAAGTATITVSTADGGKKATCAVTVPQPVIAVTGVTLNKTSTTLVVNKTEQLTATVAPSNATNKSVTWTSSNANIATVSNAGVVTAKAAGNATITVATADGGKKATCTVTVTQPVTGVTLNKTSMTLAIGKKEKLTATVLPTNATNKNVTWACSNSTKAWVSQEGEVTANWPGTSTITVTTADGGKTASCVVTVPSNIDSTKFQSRGVRNLTSSTATIYTSCKVYNAWQVGVFFGTDANNLRFLACDDSPGSTVLEVSYPIERYLTMAPNTKYYYQFYAIIDGVFYQDQIGNFTTPAQSTGTYTRINALPVPRVAQLDTVDGGPGGDCYVCSLASIQAYHQGTSNYTYGSYSRTYNGVGDYDWSTDPFWRKIYALNGNSVYIAGTTCANLPFPMEGNSYAVTTGAKNAMPFMYNCLKAGKPVSIHYSNGSTMHASVVIGYKGNNKTTLDADDFIVMEIKKWHSNGYYGSLNSQTNFNNCMNTPITRSNYSAWKNSNSTCYVTLAAWMLKSWGTEDLVLNMRWKK